MSFEEEFQQLETILKRMEAGELSLDESLADYERGVKALRLCREILDQAEQRIEELGPPGAPPDPASA